MNTCEGCKFFLADTSWPNGYPYKGWGTCQRLTDGYGYDRHEQPDKPEDGRLAIPFDYESYSAGLYISPNFGCVMWEAKI